MVMMAALLAGCRASDEAAQADNDTMPPQSAMMTPVPAAAPSPPAPVMPAATPVAAASPLVTVRAQPAPDFPMDLPPSDDAAAAEPFPREVTRFMVGRDSCDHFRGEEPYDAERRAYIAENVAILCHGSDAMLAMLRRRYGNDPSVIAALHGYEDRIEGRDDD